MTPNLDNLAATDEIVRAGKGINANQPPAAPPVPEQVAPSPAPTPQSPPPNLQSASDALSGKPLGAPEVPETVAPTPTPKPPTPTAADIFDTLQGPESEQGTTIHAGPKPVPEQPPVPQAQNAEQSLLDQIVADHRGKVTSQTPAENQALLNAIDETGRRAHESGDMEGANRAADAHAAVSSLLDEAVRNTQTGKAPNTPQQANLATAADALSGKPLSPEPAQVAPDKGSTPKPSDAKALAAAIMASVPARPVPPKDAPKPLQPATAQATNQPQPIGKHEPDTGRQILQSTDNPATLQKAAQAQAPWLERQANATVQGIPGAKVEGIREKKAPADLAEKLDQEKQPAETIPDYLGGRIVVDSPAARDQVAQKIKDSFQVVREQDNFEKGSDPYGFRSHTFQVKTPDGNSAELQVVPKEIAAVNDLTHPDYEKGERARIAGKMDQHRQYASLVKAAHDAAMESFNQRNSSTTPDASNDVPKQETPFTPKKGDRVLMDGKKPGTVTHVDPKRKVAGVKTDDGRAWPAAPFERLKPEEKKAEREITPEEYRKIKSDLLSRGLNPDDTEAWGTAVAEAERKLFQESVQSPPAQNQPVAGKVEEGGSKPAESAQPEAKGDKWIGVDLDGTLAHYDGFKGPTVIGEPIQPMVDRIKKWLAEGNNVKILTARVADDKDGKVKKAIQDWTEKHVGKRLDVTDVKDPHMVSLYDDRAVPVERNTGKLLAEPQPEGNNNNAAKPGISGKPNADAETASQRSVDVPQEEKPAGSNAGAKPAGAADERKPAADAHAAGEEKPLGQQGGGEGKEEVEDKVSQAAAIIKANPDMERFNPGGVVDEIAKQLDIPRSEANKLYVEAGRKVSAAKPARSFYKPPTPQVAPMAGTSPLGAKPEMHTYEAEVSKYAGDPHPKTVQIEAENRRHAEQLLAEKYPGMRISSAGRVEKPVEKSVEKEETKPSTEAPHEPTSRSETGGGRPAADTGGRDRAGVAPAPESVREGTDKSELSPEGDKEHGPVVRPGAPRVRSGRPQPGPGAGSDEGIDLSPAGPVIEEAEKESRKPTPRRNKDWYEHPEDWAISGGPLAKLDGNMAALEILRDIQQNPRKATDDEKTKLANYVGWGALSRVFNEEYLKQSREEESPEDYSPEGGYDYQARYWKNKATETPEYKRERERWRAANKRLRELLTPDEYKEAEDSTINAHYTSPELVRFMWDAVKKMGFKSGNVLEPAMGVGNFLGMMPPEIRSKVQAVGNDKDTVSAGISKLLYPEAQIFNKPFEDLILPNNEMDLAISNVPFFEVNVYDRNYPKLNAMLHDYFFVKSMDKVKPGGLVAFITSTGTMDRQSSAIREALAGQADLVSAFRLPSSAFKANAGTDVTTDLIILRKRLPGEEPGGESWMKAVPTKFPLEQEPGKMHEHPFNEYYLAHPENMLGTAVSSKKMRGNQRFALKKPERPIADLLKEALDRIPKNIVKTAPKPTGANQAETEAVYAEDNVQEYQYVVDDKGILKQRREGKLVYPPAAMDKGKIKSIPKTSRIKAMVKLRETMNRLLYEMKTLPDDEASNKQIAHSRAQLEKQYNSFVKQYGLVNSTANRIFNEDPHYPRLLALENYDRAKKESTPADIFRKRTIYPRQSLTSISQDPGEALQQVLAERGYPDVDLMAQLQGKTPKEAAQSLIDAGVLFRDPISGEYQTREKYLSGYVRTKLDDAKAAVAQGNKEYQANVDALEKVQPAFLHITDDPATSISVRLGGTWIPIPALEQFAKDTFKSDGTFTYTDGTWSVELDNSRTPENTNQWATQRIHGADLLQDALNLKQTTIYDIVDKKQILNADETTNARAMQERIRQEFQKWALNSKDWKEPLEKAYNYAFNNLAEQEYDGSFLTFPGMNPEIKLEPHQVNAIWRMIQDGRALLAHEVGAGKTFEMVAAVMEGRRTGVFKKPMIAVPNHIVDQFRKEFLFLYPGANILVPTEKDFDSKNRQRIMSQIATGDYDCIILPHSQFNLMDISPERQKKTIQGEIDQLDDALRGAIADDPDYAGLTIEQAEAKAASDKQKRKSQTVKQLVKSRLQFKERLKELSDLKADKAIGFDDTGVDALFIDEAHEYKNLKYFTKMQRIAGLQQANSKRSFRLLAKLQYLQEVNNGRGVFFATGTPVQNTMAELYTMMKYVAPDVLERAGIKYFDDWAANFGSVITAMELSADGRSFKARSKFARFQNVPELMRMFRAFADVKTAADLNLKRPELEGGKPIVITVPGSEKLDEVVKDLMQRAEAIRSGSVRPDEDNMLKVTSEGRKAATDLRLLDAAIKDEVDSKINVAVRQILKEHRAGEEDKLTQMVFLDMYRATDDKDNELLNLYKDMRQKLIDGGVKPEEIAIIGDYNTRAKRQALFERVNAGDVRILLGSTQRMGAGTNAQQRLKALHHIDLTWRPGDLTQREGRILRQGNMNKSVRIYNYLTERSFDAYMAQTLQSKAEFLSQILSGRSASRTITDAAADMVMSLEEMKVAASGNPDIKLKYDLEMKLAQLQTVERGFEASKRDAHSRVRSIDSSIASSKRAVIRMELAQAAIDKAKGPDGDGFTMEVDGKKFTDRKSAGEYIEAMAIPGVRFYMKVNGVEVSVDPTGTIKEHDPNVIGKDGTHWIDVPSVSYDLEFEESSSYFHNNRAPQYTMESLVRSIEANMRSIPKHIAREVKSIAANEEDKPQFQKLADREEFPEQKELEKVRADLDEVEKRLGLGNVNSGSQADKEETAAEVDTSAEPEPAEEQEEEGDDVEDGPEPSSPKDTAKKFLQGGRGANLPDSGTLSAFGFLNPAVVNQLFPGMAGGIYQWAGDGPTPGKTQQAIMREERGQMDRRMARALAALEQESNAWDKRPRADFLAFADAVEHVGGKTVADLSVKDQQLAGILEKAYQERKDYIDAMGFGPINDWIDNYFAHWWERPSLARKTIKKFMGVGKRPLEGKASFRKQRKIPTTRDGIDIGLTPATWNPVRGALMKIYEMDQFIMAHQLLKVIKDSGTAKFVRAGTQAPEGWDKIDDKIGTVWRRATTIDDQKVEGATYDKTYMGGKRPIPSIAIEDLEDASGKALVITGHYWAPADAAKVFNNFVSKGLAGRSAIFDALRWANNNLNAMQLGISAFHATVTTVNAAASDVSLGVEQLFQGKPVKAAGNALAGIALLPSLVRTIKNGWKATREYMKPGTYPEMEKEADWIARSGGRLAPSTLELSPIRKAINAWNSGTNWDKAKSLPGALLQAGVWPVLEFWVPKMKIGAFYLMAHNLLEEAQKKNWTPEKLRERMQEAWDAVDDRFGQIVYENRFWPRGLKDALQLTFRAVGYTNGDVRIYGGAIVDTAKAAGLVATGHGKEARITPRMSFALSSFLCTAILGAAGTFLCTGHLPKDPLHYLYIEDSHGIMHSIAGYPDQIVSFVKHPEQTVINKIAPLWSVIGQAINNQDFYRTEIRHTDDSAPKQAEEFAGWSAKQELPFSATGAAHLLEERGAQDNAWSMIQTAIHNPAPVAESFFGFNQAPAFIQNSKAVNMARDYERANYTPGTRTQREADRRNAKHVVEDMYRAKATGKPGFDQKVIDAYKTADILDESDLAKARFQARVQPIVAATRDLHHEQALNVYLAATPDEQKQLRPVIGHKARTIDDDSDMSAEQKVTMKKAYSDALNPKPKFKGPAVGPVV
jgi:N12 class adenine-specific DNA methylase